MADLSQAVASVLKAVMESLDSDVGKQSIGKPVVWAMQQNFRQLNTERHHAWFSGLGFYEDAARRTRLRPIPGGVEAFSDKVGLNLRLEGGVVTPGKNPSSFTGQPTKYLTIPAIPEAYRRPAAYFGNLSFVRFGKSPDALAALIEKNPKSATYASSGKKVRNVLPTAKVQGGFARRVFYWLVKSTTHKPDPSVLPDIDVIENVALGAVEDFLSDAIDQVT